MSYNSNTYNIFGGTNTEIGIPGGNLAFVSRRKNVLRNRKTESKIQKIEKISKIKIYRFLA